jgi:Ca-activated chloride channel family protein
MRARVSVLLLIVCLTTMLGAAQERATIVITITDTARAVLPGVTVRLEGPDRRTVISDARGQATFVGILPGKYRITAELAGFTTAQAELTVAAGATERRAIAMSVGAITEGVTVTGQSPTLDSSRGVRVGGNVSGVAGGTAAYHPGGWYEPRWHRDDDRNAEKYSDHGENAFRTVSAEPLSTFSIDVDTASYSNVRRFLNEGTLPPEQAVRIEELLNYFKVEYPQPKGKDPFSITTEVAESPWNDKHRLVLIGLKGREIAENRTPRRNLVFLIDVSGSMADRDKLPLVQHGLRMLAGTLTANDRVAIVVYAGASGVVLESTSGDRKERIDRAIANLHAGGSTNGGAGITLAYKLARESFITGGVNRVILATDGDFNVGVTDQKELERLIERERESGVFLSVLGVGTGNINDTFMELLADKGNGNYSYLDTMHEAHRVLVKEAGSTFVTIAKDVKIQVEFNPKLVDGYRLIGYENRMLRDQDFNDDRKDAGEIGAGHSVTAIYEIVPAGVGVDRPRVDPLKYSTAPQAAAASSPGRFDNELLTVKLRYKAPDGDVSDLTSASVTNRVSPMSANLGFASAVAEAGMLLRGSQLAKNASYPAAIARARQFRGEDPDGYRAEFARLMELAATLSKRQRTER